MKANEKDFSFMATENNIEIPFFQLELESGLVKV